MALGISLSYSRNDLPALVSEQGISNRYSPAEIEELWKRHQHFPQKLFIHLLLFPGSVQRAEWPRGPNWSGWRRTVWAVPAKYRSTLTLSPFQGTAGTILTPQSLFLLSQPHLLPELSHHKVLWNPVPRDDSAAKTGPAVRPPQSVPQPGAAAMKLHPKISL